VGPGRAQPPLDWGRRALRYGHAARRRRGTSAAAEAVVLLAGDEAASSTVAAPRSRAVVVIGKRRELLLLRRRAAATLHPASTQLPAFSAEFSRRTSTAEGRARDSFVLYRWSGIPRNLTDALEDSGGAGGVAYPLRGLHPVKQSCKDVYRPAVRVVLDVSNGL
jgi:hypothetical protein